MLTRTFSVLRKETREILRDPYTLSIALVLPLVMLFLFAYGVNTDVRNIQLAVMDFDQTSASRDYVQAIFSSSYFDSVGTVQSYERAGDLLDRDTADAVLVILPGFARTLSNGEQAQIQTLLDGSYTPSAQVAESYIEAINAAYNGKIVSQFIESRSGPSLDRNIPVRVQSRV